MNRSATRHDDVDGVVLRLSASLATEEADMLAENVRRLFSIHERQWDLEDACRDVATPLSTLGSIKQAIDDSNARRVAAIRDIDLLVDMFLVARPPEGGILHWPVTLGQALDQLVIVVIKSERANANAEALGALRRHQLLALEDMRESLVSGRLVLPPMSTVKHYSSAVKDDSVVC
jgi:Protein of unknown function (DUF4254)